MAIYITHEHSSLSYQRKIYENMIGVVMIRLVSMGLKVPCPHGDLGKMGIGIGADDGNCPPISMPIVSFV